MTNDIWMNLGIQNSFSQDYGLLYDNLALTASALAAFLMLLLLHRVSSLYRASQLSRHETEEGNAVGFSSQLIDFAQFQINSVHQGAGEKRVFEDQENRSEVGLFFIGAVEFVVKMNGLSSKQRHMLIVELLRESLDFSAKEVSKVYSQALVTCSNSPSKNTVKLGAKAFKEWSTNDFSGSVHLSTVLS